MRLRLAALLVTGLALAITPSAAADKPLKVPIVIEPLTLTGVCEFPVQFEPIGPQHQKIIAFSDGRVTINGQLSGRVINLDDPSKFWEGTASGTIFLTPLPDGSTEVKGTGVNLFFFFAGNLGEGEPGALFLLKGKTIEILDPGGVPVPGSFEHHGFIENLCVTLA
jgi:hypothetical protein